IEDSSKEVVVDREKLSGKELKIEFIKITDAQEQEVETLTPGNEYWMEFSIASQKGAKLGAHFRVGSDEVVFADSEYAGIVGFDAKVDSFSYGRTYNSKGAGNEAVDRANYGRAGEYNKWLELNWNNANELTIVKVKIRVRENADLHTKEIEFHYRAWIREGPTVIRDPEDSVLLFDLYNNKRGSLYAETYSISFKLAPSNTLNFCEKGICLAFKFLDSKGIEYNPEEFVADKDNDYALLVILDSKINQIVNLQINSSSEVGLTGFDVGFFGKIPAAEPKQELSIMRLGLAANYPKKIYVYFRAIKEGNAQLFIKLNSKRGEIAKQLFFNVQEAKEIVVKLRPEFIEPNKDFDIILTDKQGTPITNAKIEIRASNNQLLTTKLGNNTANNGANGVYRIQNNFRPGKIRIIITAEGYKKKELEVYVARKGSIAIVPSTIRVFLSKETKAKVVQAQIINQTDMEIRGISYELTNNSIPNQFKLDISIPAVLTKQARALITINVSYNAETEASLSGFADLVVSGLIGSAVVKTKARIEVYYNKRIMDTSCLKFDKEKLVAYLTTTQFSGAQLSWQQTLNPNELNSIEFQNEGQRRLIADLYNDPRYSSGFPMRYSFGAEELQLAVTNNCNTELELKTASREITPNNITIEMPKIVKLAKGETKKLNIKITNRINRAAVQQKKYEIIFESAELTKTIPLEINFVDARTLITAPPSIVLFLAQAPQEKIARAAVPIFIRNIGRIPISNVELALANTDDWRRNGVSVSITPQTIGQQTLRPNETLLPTRWLIAETDSEKSIPRPLFGAIVVRGIVNNQRKVLRVIPVWIHVSGSSCLRATPVDALAFISEESGYGVISKRVKVKNYCMQEVRLLDVEPRQLAGNRLMMTGYGIILPNNAEQEIILRLEKNEDMLRENEPIRIKAWLVRSLKTTYSNPLTITIKIGEKAIETGPVTRDITMNYCGTTETVKLKMPKIGSDCSNSYCDAKNAAKFIISKLENISRQVKNKIHAYNSNARNFNCSRANFCTFAELGITPAPFYLYMQNDYLSAYVIAHELSNATEMKGYSSRTSSISLESVAASGWGFGQVILQSNLKGCGRYMLSIKGAVQVVENRILTDRILFYIEASKRKTTKECENRVENVLNFMPVDEGYSIEKPFGTWLTTIETTKELEEAAKKFAKDFLGSENRVAQNPGSNRMLLKFGDTEGATLKIEIEKTGKADEPKTIKIYVNPGLTKETSEKHNTSAAINSGKIFLQQDTNTSSAKEVDENVGKPLTQPGAPRETTVSNEQQTQTTEEKTKLEEIANILTAFTKYQIKGCIDKEHKYMLIQEYAPYKAPEIIGKDELQLYINEHCIKLTLESELEEKFTLKTDWKEHSDKTGVEYVKLRDMHGNEIKEDRVVETKKDPKGYPKFEFQLCAKGAANYPQIMMTEQPFVRVKAVSASTKAMQQARESEWKTINFLVCGIHPYDLFKKLLNQKEGTYFATVGWKGNPDEVSSRDIFKALERYGELEKARKMVETTTGAKAGKRVLASLLKSEKAKGAGVYIASCSAVSLVCNGILFLGNIPAILGAIALDCVAPGMWLYASGTKYGEAIVKATQAIMDRINQIIPIKSWLDALNQRIGIASGRQLEEARQLEFVALTGMPLPKFIQALRVTTPAAAAEDAAQRLADAIVRTKLGGASMLVKRNAKAKIASAIRKELIARLPKRASGKALQEALEKELPSAVQSAGREIAPYLVRSTRAFSRSELGSILDSARSELINAKLKPAEIAADAAKAIPEEVSIPQGSSGAAVIDDIAGKQADAIVDRMLANMTAQERATARHVLEGMRSQLRASIKRNLQAQITENAVKIPRESAEAAIKSAVERAVVENSEQLGRAFEKEIAESAFGRISKEELSSIGRRSFTSRANQTLRKLLSRQMLKDLTKGIVCGATSAIIGVKAYTSYLKSAEKNLGKKNVISFSGVGNKIDDDHDNAVDEETCDGIDNDNDGLIDEDCG
ncbi:MAG: hypothetical protein J7L14_02695, partial [Candidatus Diapherotrites archaeon]|nr:hypothetical protein [Candidatus Diapherotrites archaeon]